jgi:protein-arginine kinase activator protein McsA|tara:strand:+ start:127 stop:375 length:249 start_codon:yes stop_codon:yes gene_type:complete
MTNKDIEKIAQRVAELVINELMYHVDTFVVPTRSTSNEEDLLAELASTMTQLDFELQRENYEKCKELQDKIKKIEQKLKNFK